MNNSVRAAVAGTLVTAGLLSGTAGVAEAQTPARAERVQAPAVPVLCSTVDQLEGLLNTLAGTADPAVIDATLAQVIALLQQLPSPVVPPALLPVYQWLVGNLQLLRSLVAALPLPLVTGIVNDLARHLAAALENVACT
ncbi:hypothetical protein FNH05_36970, partial [Amycolatopsis rhizosphaerae]